METLVVAFGLLAISQGLTVAWAVKLNNRLRYLEGVLRGKGIDVDDDSV